MRLKNGKKLYNERGITFFHETERYVNNLNVYNRSKNGTNLWDDLIHIMYILFKKKKLQDYYLFLAYKLVLEEIKLLKNIEKIGFLRLQNLFLLGAFHQ